MRERLKTKAVALESAWRGAAENREEQYQFHKDSLVVAAGIAEELVLNVEALIDVQAAADSAPVHAIKRVYAVGEATAI